MSFFDDDEPPVARARRPRPATASPRRPSPPPGDPEAIRRRQLVAAGVVIVFFIVVIFGVKACSNSAQKRNLRSYNDSIGAIVQKSDREVATPLFQLLSGAASASSGKSVELQNQVNALKLKADQQLKQAENLDVPDEVVSAQRYALLTLELRRDAMSVIAEQLQPALSGTDNGAASRRIAGEMRAFDASDVIWSQRAIPAVRTALEDNDIPVGGSGEEVATSVFLRDGAWLDPTYVADKLGSGTGGASGRAAPGRHGHALISTSVDGTTLSTSATNQVSADPPPAFEAQVQNQGDNDEKSVRVRVQVGKIVTTKIVSTTAGATATATVTLSRAPPTGSVQTVKVTVLPVPGEQTTDNNTQSYPVLFSG